MVMPSIKPENGSLFTDWMTKTGGEINPGVLQSLWHIYYHRLPQYKLKLGLWNAGDALTPEQVESLIDSVILSQIGIENPGAYRLSMLETVKREREVHK